MSNRDYLDLEEQRLMLDREEQGKIALLCAKCNTEIFEGQDYFFYDRDCLCEECFDELQKDEKFEARRIAGDDDDV